MSDFSEYVARERKRYREFPAMERDGRELHRSKCVVFHDTDVQITGYNVLDALSEYSEVAVRVSSYSYRWLLFKLANYPSMCGGSLVTVQTVSEYELFNPNLYVLAPARLTGEGFDEDPVEYMQNLGKGILLMSTLGAIGRDITVRRLLREMKEYFDTADGGVTCDLAVEYQSACLVVHYADEHEHACRHSGRNTRHCPWCGRFVDGNGYCTYCDEYTVGGGREDIRISNREDWVKEALKDDCSYVHDAFLCASYIYQYKAETMLPMRGAMQRSPVVRGRWSAGIDVYTKWTARLRGFRSPATNPDPVDYLASLFIHGGLVDSPAAISSNVGTPQYPETRWVMAMLIKHADKFAERGIRVVVPPEMATNPNERHHYIDSVVLLANERLQ